MEPVLFEERLTAGGHHLGVVTLNQPATLNALSHAMVQLMTPRLLGWARDPRVVMVIIEGAGDKALCAGGDLHGLYRSMLAFRRCGSSDIRDNREAAAFFGDEYRLDDLIHRFPKPVLCWGHGIVMGGGIGLMSGASHRVVTDRSRLAMPEITVGLYPDVGGSWQLSRAPGHCGLFLALTGAQLQAADAIFAGLADLHIHQGVKDDVMQALSRQPWAGRAAEDRVTLSHVLDGFASLPQPCAGPLRRHYDLIEALCSKPAFDEIVARILALGQSHADDPWLARAAATLQAGSPTSARLGYELQRRTRLLSLADVFRIELVVSLHCAAHGDFAEGIRALLIDKDRQPKWQRARFEEADATWAEAFFEDPWPPGSHPLADLGMN